MKIKACIPTVLAALSLFILPASAEPLSPPGTGTVIDSGTDEDGKEFYTIQAPDKAVFYLIIDRQRGTENVYFLDAVADNLPEILLQIPADDEYHLVESRLQSVVDGVIHNDLPVWPHRLQLLDPAAEPAADAGCHYH